MTFRWQLPNAPPDPDALERMKQHFRKPTELMPIPWFMGWIDFYTNLAETPTNELTGEELSKALHDIAGGIVPFPEVHYVPIWKEWFHYLLPYAITKPDGFSIQGTVLSQLIAASIIIYPNELPELYSGFRDDFVYTVGTRLVPLKLARDLPIADTFNNGGFLNAVFNDVWDFSPYPDGNPGLYDEFSHSMLFCLKYLRPSEVESWTASIVQIDSPQWQWAIIGWWLALNQFLKLTESWPNDGNIESWLNKSGLISDFWLAKVAFFSRDQLFPAQNLAVFQATLQRQLSLERFHTWAAEIRSHDTMRFDATSTYPLNEDLRLRIERDLHTFEAAFFAPR